MTKKVIEDVKAPFLLSLASDLPSLAHPLSLYDIKGHFQKARDCSWGQRSHGQQRHLYILTITELLSQFRNQNHGLTTNKKITKLMLKAFEKFFKF